VVTSFVWPILWILPKACSSIVGFLSIVGIFYKAMMVHNAGVVIAHQWGSIKYAREASVKVKLSSSKYAGTLLT